MIVILHRCPTSCAATQKLRDEARETVHGIATTHGLGSVVELYLAEQEIAARDARGSAIRAYARDLGAKLNKLRPRLLIVSGSDLNRHLLAALRKYKVSKCDLTILSSYSSADRFESVDFRWKSPALVVVRSPDDPDVMTTIVPCLDLGLWLRTSHRGRPIPFCYWTDFITGLIRLVHQPRLNRDEKARRLASLARPMDEKAAVVDAIIRDNMNY